MATYRTVQHRAHQGPLRIAILSRQSNGLTTLDRFLNGERFEPTRDLEEGEAEEMAESWVFGN